MHPIILIPARMAATRLPDKPLADIGGEPMIVRVLQRATLSGIKDIVVACVGRPIAEAVERAGGRAVITDPGLPSGSDRIWQALQKIDPEKTHDVIINLQGDMPTFDPAVIKKTLALLEDPAVDIATPAAVITGEKERDDPAVVKTVVSGVGCQASDKFFFDTRLSAVALAKTDHPSPVTCRALYFSRQAVPYGDGLFYHHIGLYVYRRPALEKFVALPPSVLEKREKLEQLRALEAGMHIGVAVVDAVPLGVDTPETLQKAREWYEQAVN
ncbi:MAG: 3-deoxy-manno-octulosonate cytidylyltransferase [Pseudomonadota bacterium]|nr:3-deoxy-manno-octulosonate cytidylyltransferase [Pseudomonadota bacterium]